MSRIVYRDHQPAVDGGDGVLTRLVIGDGAMLNLTELRPGAAIEEHRHPHEQVGLVLAGEVTLRIEGVEHRLGRGTGYQISSDSMHALQAGPEGATLADTFHPLREDYRALLAPGSRSGR